MQYLYIIVCLAYIFGNSLTYATLQLGESCGNFDFNACKSRKAYTCGATNPDCLINGSIDCESGLVCGIESTMGYNARCRGCINDVECGNGMYCDLSQRVGEGFTSSLDDANTDCLVMGLGDYTKKLLKNHCDNDSNANAYPHNFHFTALSKDCNTIQFNPGTCKPRTIRGLLLSAEGERDSRDHSCSTNLAIQSRWEKFRIEAEEFSNAEDVELKNKGNYDNDASKEYGVDLKELYNRDIVIGYIKPDEWVEYKLDTSEVNGKWDSFNIRYNYGRGTDGLSKVVVVSNGKTEGKVDLDSTGEWDNHTSFTDNSLDIPIDSDCTTLKFEFMDGGIDFDYFVLIKSGDSNNEECGIKIVKLHSGLKVEAEDVSNAEDVELENRGSYNNGNDASKEYGVDLKELYNRDIVIGYIKPGEWVEYKLDTSEVNGKWDSFNIRYNYGRGTDGSSKVVIVSNGKTEGKVDLDSTGEWDNHTSFTDNSLDIPIDSDCTTLKFEFVDGGIHFDYFVIIKSGFTLISSGKNIIESEDYAAASSNFEGGILVAEMRSPYNRLARKVEDNLRQVVGIRNNQWIEYKIDTSNIQGAVGFYVRPLHSIQWNPVLPTMKVFIDGIEVASEVFNEFFDHYCYYDGDDSPTWHLEPKRIYLPMPNQIQFTLRFEFQLEDASWTCDEDPSIYFLDNIEVEVVKSKSDVIYEVLFHECSKYILAYDYFEASEGIDHESYEGNTNWIQMNDEDWVEYIISTKEFGEYTNAFSINMVYDDEFHGRHVGELGFVLRVYINGDQVGVIDIIVVDSYGFPDDGFQSSLASNILKLPEYITESGDASMTLRLVVERKFTNPYQYASNSFALGSFELIPVAT
jgi:hypothetical protein